LNRDKIQVVIDKLNTKSCSQEEYDEMVKFIDNIGEPFIKHSMENMLGNMKIVEKFSTLTQECIDYLETLGWYNDNETIKKCILRCEESIYSVKDIIRINTELLSLYKNDTKKYSKDIKNSETDLKDSKLEYKMLQTIEEWLGKQKKTAKIQDCLKTEKA
jgi:hypothetical protein